MRYAVSPASPRARCLRALRQRGFYRHMRYAVSLAPPRARGARAAAQSKNGCGFKQKPAQRETSDSPSGANHSFLSLSRFAGFMVQRIEKQSGTALTPGGRWLRPPRQSGIASNRCHFKVYVLRLFEVLPLNFWVYSVRKYLPSRRRNKRYAVSLAPPRARGRRPRRAVGERLWF